MNAYQKEYIHRINKVIDYIEEHIDEELSLEILSSVASFSPFHFHRIFAAFVGETLYDFIKRLRIEKAASLLINDPDIPVSEVAVICGFNSTSVFCRNFKDRFRISAGEFRKSWSKDSKNRQSLSKNSKLSEMTMDYVCENNLNISTMKDNFQIKDMPAMDVLYCRHTGRFDQIGQAYEKLFRWAGPRGLLQFPETKGLTYYHDDPKVTDAEKIRQSACITVKGDVKTEGEIGKMKIPGGKYVVGEFEIFTHEFQQAWDSTCVWLSQSGYQPADACPYELYHNNGELDPQKKFRVDICIPVKAL
ncbi:MAG TPA: GyrI-like domain-containing protein [Bacteroidales bacterium]|nr:GyrI-like domain-containing protein [Bacteroidales bacterium]